VTHLARASGQATTEKNEDARGGHGWRTDTRSRLGDEIARRECRRSARLYLRAQQDSNLRTPACESPQGSRQTYTSFIKSSQSLEIAKHVGSDLRHALAPFFPRLGPNWVQCLSSNILATVPVARARVATCSRESGTPSIAVLRKIEASRTRYICATRFSRGPLRSIVTMFATVPVEARHASRGLGLVVARHDVGLQWSK